MAHHNSTPQSVLDAPSRTFATIVAHSGATRQERRHGVALSMKPADHALYLRTPNAPHVSRATRRGKKVRRNAAA